MISFSVHPCEKEDNGGCQHVCEKDGDDAKCSCHDGFKLAADGKSCEKIHPCDKPTKGGCDQTCVKVGDEHICACKEPEFKLNADGKKCDKGN